MKIQIITFDEHAPGNEWQLSQIKSHLLRLQDR